MKTMRTISQFLLLLGFFSLTSCENVSIPVIDDSEPLNGHWINPVCIDTLWQYDRSATFKENAGGIYFKSDNEFVERKNAGWCGTPPVSYADFDGTWARHDSVLNITVGYWGGTADYKWKIISITDDKLIIYRIEDTYHYTE
jgi:hypothetical protein